MIVKPQRARVGAMNHNAMAKILTLCLVALAVNAVLIQTVVLEESSLKNVVRAGVLGLVIIAMVLNNTRIPVAVTLLVLISFLLLLLTGNPDQLSYIFVLLLVPALMAIKERRVEKAVLLGSLGSLALIFAFLALGITQNQVLEPRSRVTYGTAGVPFFYNVVYGAFAMLVLYSQKHFVRRRRTVVVVSLAATTYLFLQTDARGGYVSFLLFLVLLVAVPRLSRSGAFRMVAGLLPLVFLLTSFYIASQATNDTANRLLSYRPRLLGAFLANVDLFDVLLSTSVKQFDERVSTVTTVDNSYLHLMVGGGLLLCIAFIAMFARAMRSLFEQGGHVEIAFLIATCAYFNSESLLLRIENLFVVFFWYLVVRYAMVKVSPRDDVAPALPPALARTTTEP